MIRARLFIRNDDVWTLDKNFRFFFDLAIDRKLPVIYAVIPGKMEQGLIRFLCRAKEKTPGLLDIVQHGWLHVNHSTNGSQKYEFGESRSFQRQREDIQRGLKQMRLAFEDHFMPAFVPPFHGYDERTLRILEQENFQIFSAGGRKPQIKSRLVELPSRISFSRYDSQKVSINTAGEMMAMLVRDIGRRPLSGIVTHHADFVTAASRKELTQFFSIVEALKNTKEWRILLFSDLWGK